MKSLILPPLSALYSAIIRSRTALYERGTFRTLKLPKPVVSIGNITTGGTGKTPLVEWVSHVLAHEGKKVCILTRGYGRKNPQSHVLVSDGRTIFTDASQAGDEAFLLATNLLGVAAVVSDPDRVAAGEGAIKHLGSDCFVLDDGFQHLRLARDLNVVTIDATQPWGGGQMLPYGRLREPLKSLKRADCIVLTRCDQVQDVERIILKIMHFSGDRPVFRSRMRTRSYSPLILSDSNPTPLQPIAAFCGVGNPESFFNHLRQDGYEALLQKSFPDHHDYTQEDVAKLVNSARHAGASSLITTAKDAVKLHRFKFEIPCYSLDIEIVIESEGQLKRIILETVG